MTDPFPNYLQVIGDKRQQTDKQKKSCYTKKSSHRISAKSTGPEYQKPVAKIGLSKPPCTSIVIKFCEAEGSLIDGEIQMTLPTCFSLQSKPLCLSLSTCSFYFELCTSSRAPRLFPKVTPSNEKSCQSLNISIWFQTSRSLQFLLRSLLCNLQWCLLTL